jgi:Flp pilus assembly protein TadD
MPAALEHYRAAARLKPNDSEVAEAVAAVEFKIKNKPALEAQAQRAKQANEMAKHSQAAKEAFAAQNFTDAVSHLDPLAKAIPDDPKIQYALGQSLRALKYYEWAAYRLKMAIYLDPENDLYRETLVELDKEVQDARRQALAESATAALSQIQPFVFPEVAHTGLRHHDY